MSTTNNGQKKARLTIDELKKCKGFENYTDEQAEETCQSLEKLSIMYFELYIKDKQREKEKSKIYGAKLKTQQTNDDENNRKEQDAT